ncbi:flagellar basal body protein, partial [Anaerobiospirillum succiniciproducens]
MFGISVSGIKNSQKHIDVTSNNISNTNSYGFKKSRAEFA